MLSATIDFVLISKKQVIIEIVYMIYLICVLLQQQKKK